MLQDAYIKSFLEIPVVLGITLCQAKFVTNSYFKEPLQKDLQKKELIHSIRSIIFGLPEDADFLEFSVQDYYAYLYRLDDKYKILTLVLHDNNVVKSFRAKQLCAKLQEDINLTIKIFDELSNQDSLPEQIIKEVHAGDSVQKFSQIYSHASKKIISEPDLDLILDALNYLSHFVCSFLGPKITSNFWNISRPKNEWLFQFEIKYSSEIIFCGDPDKKINPLAILSVREWTRNFMNQCCQLIRDLPERLEKESINEDYRRIISIYTSEYLQEMSNFSGSSNESLFGDNFL